MTPPSARKPADALPPELFPRLARNAPLLLIISAVGVALGALVLIAAAGIAILWDAPLAYAAAGMVFFLSSLMLTPSIHLFYYRIEVLDAASAPNPDSLTRVLRQQVRFWRFIGMAAIVWMAMIGLTVVSR